MGKYDHYREGDYNAVCAHCGRKGKASEMRKLPAGIPGAGMLVHPEHYVERNPQDFVRGIPEKQVPPWIQPPPEALFLEDGSATTVQLQDITHSINTTGKYLSKCVLNTTTSAQVFANGAAAADTWSNADESTTYTPV